MSKIDLKYIPLDKSWIIRMGVLDVLSRKRDIINFLEQQENLNDDLQALHRVATMWWGSDEPIDVGESGTIYRFFKFASWKFGLNKKFILRGTLKTRKICDDSKIINYSIKELLKLDNGTSQWASASILTGNRELIDNPAFKLKVTYDAVEHWKKQRKKGECWCPRYDKTILQQAITFFDLLNGKKVNFVPEQAEDYCFARAFGFITKEEGLSRWPQLVGHETNRIEEMEKVLSQTKRGEPIDSIDHRVVQAITMWGMVNNKYVEIMFPDVVNKSWPRFWKMLENNQQK